MSETPQPDRGAIAFGERLLTVLGEGRFVATYKYAVILALLDLCLEKSSRSGSAPESVTTVELARKVLELYWPHARPFRGRRVPRAATGQRQARIVSLIERFREAYPDTSGQNPYAAEQLHTRELERLLEEIEWTLVKMPLPKLQRVGTEVIPFLYTIGWDDAVTPAAFRRGDNMIRFVGDSSDHMVRLAGLIRPLVQREWAALVAQLNTDLVDAHELEAFLFGVDRAALDRVRGDLRDLQRDHCFYCEDWLSSNTDLDHFVPWSRYPDNGIDNLVAVHRTCNARKRDRLAAAQHVERWVERSAARTADLLEIARRRSWEAQPSRTLEWRGRSTCGCRPTRGCGCAKTSSSPSRGSAFALPSPEDPKRRGHRLALRRKRVASVIRR